MFLQGIANLLSGYGNEVLTLIEEKTQKFVKEVLYVHGSDSTSLDLCITNHQTLCWLSLSGYLNQSCPQTMTQLNLGNK